MSKWCREHRSSFLARKEDEAGVEEKRDMSTSRPDKPVVSIVVEGYNESRDLGKAVNTIEALRRQDFPAHQVEIILMGSAAQVTEWRALYAQGTPFWGIQAV